MDNTNSVTIQMEKILDTYSKEVARATNNSIDVVAKESVRKLKSTSPRSVKHTRKYAEGWGLKRDRNQKNRGINDVIVRNKTNYQLTHLLENGHIIRNGKGVYGRTNGIKHIAPVEEWARDELPREIERELET